MIRYKALWTDGYITIIILENNTYRLEGKKLTFETLLELENYYKGKIKNISKEN